MRHQRRGRKLGRDSAHRNALMMNMAAALIEHGRIRTTLSKAKELRPYVEKLVTTACRNDLHARRMVMSKLHMADKASSRKAGKRTVVQQLFEEVAPRFVDRPGGYTRIIKIGPRPGDAAPMAFIEFVDYVPTPRSETIAAVQAHEHSHEHGREHAHA